MMKRGTAHLIFWLSLISIFGLTICGCDKKSEGNLDNKPAAQPAGTSSPAGDARQIIERYRALDNSSASIIKMRAEIKDEIPTAVTGSASPHIQLTISRKREADGRVLMLVEFIAPPEERDRDALITISPQGEVEGTRY